MIKHIKNIVARIYYGFYYFLKTAFLNKDYIFVHWDKKKKNFGDIITPFLISKITNKKIIRVARPKYLTEKHYFVIGSILDRATNFSIIWGSGFIDKNNYLNSAPLKVAAVRGPKTRELLLQHGIDCPEIYGDPALLLPRIYNPVLKCKKYKLGIVPHYVDRDNIILKEIAKNKNVKIIHIQNKNPLIVISEILACEKIASSSLHGIIVADAYRIPSLWIKLSDEIAGNGFKFLDYFASVKRTDKDPFIMEKFSKLEDLLVQFDDKKIDIDINKLLLACPFGEKAKVNFS